MKVEDILNPCTPTDLALGHSPLYGLSARVDFGRAPGPSVQPENNAHMCNLSIRDETINLGPQPTDELRQDQPPCYRQGEDFDKQILRTSALSYPHNSPRQTTEPSSGPPVHPAVPMSERATHPPTTGADPHRNELTTSPRQDKAGRTVHTFLDEKGNYKQYYIVCHASSCPYLGFKTIAEIFSHLARVHREMFVDYVERLDAGGFVLAIPEARVQDHEKEYGLSSAGLLTVRCLSDECQKREYSSIGPLRSHLTRVHRKNLGLPAGTQAIQMAWRPTLNIHQETGPPHSLGLGPTAPLLIKTVDHVAFSDSVTRGLHPGAMLANFTKTQKRKREPIIEISSDEDDAGGDSITPLHQQWPLKRPNMGENDPLLV